MGPEGIAPQGAVSEGGVKWLLAAALAVAITSALACSRAAESPIAGHSFSHFYSQEKRREQWDYETQQKRVNFHQQPLGDGGFAPPCGAPGQGALGREQKCFGRSRATRTRAVQRCGTRTTATRWLWAAAPRQHRASSASSEEERHWVFCLTKRDQAVSALSRPRLLLVAIARPAEIPPLDRCPPLLPSNSRRHPAARPSLGGFMLPLAHFLMPAQHRHRRLQALQGRAWEGGSCPSPEHPRGVAINQQPPHLQSCRELIPQAGADPASFGARIQRGGAAAGQGCWLGCRGDLWVRGP